MTKCRTADISGFEISNIKIRKVELFDFPIFEFIFYFYDWLNNSDTQNTYTNSAILEI